jgi:predicted DCC family thiol-disulfide oxidoreductase YuxK
MTSLENKLIIYDSNCKLCSTLRSVILQVTAIRNQQIKAYAELEPELAKKVDGEKFRNGMALVDTGEGNTIYGSDGIAYVFSSQSRILHILLKAAFFRGIFGFLYQVIAYNRYIIATPKSKFVCNCYPDKIIRFRIAYILIALLISVLLTVLFGISLREFFPGTGRLYAAVQMLLIAGTGWVLQMLLAAVCMRDKAVDYFGHLGTIMVAGLLVLLPSIAITSLLGWLNPWIPGISVLCSSSLMLYMHLRRSQFIGISTWWTLGWFLFLQSTAIFWVCYFHSN